jgi:hypothetical protein
MKLGESAKDIHENLVKAWGDATPGYSTIKRWTHDFLTGERNMFEDAEKPGRPRVTRTVENVEKVKELILDNPRLSTRDILINDTCLTHMMFTSTTILLPLLYCYFYYYTTTSTTTSTTILLPLP